MIYFLQIPLFLVGKVTGDKVGWEQEGQSCRTISSSGGGQPYLVMVPCNHLKSGDLLVFTHAGMVQW